MSNHASIHLLNRKVFAYYQEVVGGTECHIVRSKHGRRVYPGTPSEVDAGMVVALMSKDNAVGLVAHSQMPTGLPKDTVEALKPLLNLL